MSHSSTGVLVSSNFWIVRNPNISLTSILFKCDHTIINLYLIQYIIMYFLTCKNHIKYFFNKIIDKKKNI